LGCAKLFRTLPTSERLKFPEMAVGETDLIGVGVPIQFGSYKQVRRDIPVWTDASPSPVTVC
jgi:hypothetical protein